MKAKWITFLALVTLINHLASCSGSAPGETTEFRETVHIRSSSLAGDRVGELRQMLMDHATRGTPFVYVDDVLFDFSQGSMGQAAGCLNLFGDYSLAEVEEVYFVGPERQMVIDIRTFLKDQTYCGYHLMVCESMSHRAYLDLVRDLSANGAKGVFSVIERGNAEHQTTSSPTGDPWVLIALGNLKEPDDQSSP